MNRAVAALLQMNATRADTITLAAVNGQPVQSDLARKLRIRRSALELFATHGYNDVFLRDIGSHAQVSTSLVVHHFGTKAGLLHAVDDAILEHAETVVDAAFAVPVDTPRDLAVCIGDALFRAFASMPFVRPYLCRALLNHRDAWPSTLRKRMTPFGRQLFERIEAVVGRVDPVAAERYTDAMLTMVLGHLVFDRLMASAKPTDVDALASSNRAGLHVVFADLDRQASSTLGPPRARRAAAPEEA